MSQFSMQEVARSYQLGMAKVVPEPAGQLRGSFLKELEVETWAPWHGGYPGDSEKRRSKKTPNQEGDTLGTRVGAAEQTEPRSNVRELLATSAE